MMDQNRIRCPMRHKENGNCLPLGGFCTSVSDEICDALHNAYMRGRYDEETEQHALTFIPTEGIYGQYTDTAGNYHWFGTRSGEHIIKAEENQ